MHSFIRAFVGLILFSTGNICAAEDILSQFDAQVTANGPAIYGTHPLREAPLTLTSIQFADQDVIHVFLAGLKLLDAEKLNTIGFERELVSGSKYYALMFGVPALKEQKNNISANSMVRILRVAGRKVYWQGGQEEIEVTGLENFTQPMDFFKVVAWGMGMSLGGVRPTLSAWAQSKREHLPSYIKHSPFKEAAAPAVVPKEAVCEAKLDSGPRASKWSAFLEFLIGLFK